MSLVGQGRGFVVGLMSALEERTLFDTAADSATSWCLKYPGKADPLYRDAERWLSPEMACARKTLRAFFIRGLAKPAQW
jgi:hypothetical protein